MTHPLHPALVHFPIACWSLATLADAASPMIGDSAWSFATVLLALGCVTALFAIATGLIDYVRLRAEHPAVPFVEHHMQWVVASWIAFAGSLAMRWDGQLLPPSALAYALSAVGFGMLCMAGWLGAELVYTHGVGVHPRRTTARMLVAARAERQAPLHTSNRPGRRP